MLMGENSVLTNSLESTAATQVQKVYRSFRTRRMLADSAIVADRWWQVLEYSLLTQSTVSFFNSMKPETAIKQFRSTSSNAARVGKGSSQDDRALKLAFEHWIEAIDPRHRYGHNLHVCYQEWCKSQAGQPFFYWLDIGDGKEVDIKDCPRSLLQKQCIKYLGPQEREQYEYVLAEGKIVHKETNEFLDTAKSPSAKWIFIMSTSKKLYVGQKKKGSFHHSSFLAGGTTIVAGRLITEQGQLKRIWAYSGHYRPTDENLHHFLTFLLENKVNFKEVQIPPSCSEDFLKDVKQSAPQERDITEVVTVSETSTFSTTVAAVKDTAITAMKELLQQITSTSKIETSGGNPSQTLELTSSLQNSAAEELQRMVIEKMKFKVKNTMYQLHHNTSSKQVSGVSQTIGGFAEYRTKQRLTVKLSSAESSSTSCKQFKSVKAADTSTTTCLCPSKLRQDNKDCHSFFDSSLYDKIDECDDNNQS